MKWFAARAKAAFSFSLLALATLVWGQDYSAIRDELGYPPTLERARSIQSRRANELQEYDPDLAIELAEVTAGRDTPDALARLARSIEVRRLAQSGVEADPDKARAIASDIKRSPIYQDHGPRKASNWLDRAFDKMGDALDRILKWLLGRRSNRDASGSALLGPWLTIVMWGLLGVAAIGLLFLALRAFGPFKWARRSKRALLDEDEPERTADEWLGRAAELEREGKYREAVRCLYLACLVRLDEAEVARFVRTQTNWEHVRRVEESPRAPTSIDLRAATRAFDSIWYGNRTRGQDDVADFRRIYEDLWNELRARRAA